MSTRGGFDVESTCVGRSIVALAMALGLAATAAVGQAGVSSVPPLEKVRSGGVPARDGRPKISIVGCRNGRFSWQLVVPGGAGGVKAAAGDLMGPDGTKIPASAIEVRYAKLDGPDGFYDGLEVAPVSDAKDAVIWITVSVPGDAKPGEYSGSVALTGAAAVKVPLSVDVVDWILPGSKEFSTFLDLVQSPESVALQYKVPMWSDKHFELLEESFKLMGQVGSKVVYISMLRRTDFGDDYSMVFWKKNADGKLKHDLSLFKRYMDLAVKHLGKVPVVCLYAWHSETGGGYFGGGRGAKSENAPTPISIKDGAGKFGEGVGPAWGTPGVQKFWKPVFDDIRADLTKRGMSKSMMVGVATDMRPSKDAVAGLKAAAPDAKWVVACHPYTTKIGDVPVGYLAYVWGITTTPVPGVKPKWGLSRAYGWANPRMEAAFPRYGCSIIGNSLRDWSALPAYRLVMEAALTSPAKVKRHKSGLFGKGLYGDGLRGIGRIGADFWNVLADKRGRRRMPIHLRYVKKGDHAVNMRYSVSYLLQAGKDKPISSARMENVREGIQECEARISIERALLDKAKEARLGAALAKKCRELLDERTRALVEARKGAKAGKSSDPGWKKFRKGAWQQRSKKLFAVAGEVARKLGN